MSKVEEFFKKNQPILKLSADINTVLFETKIIEVAFIGRSNVGKSSIINSITNSNIALTSKTPGRTKQLNFFQLSNKLIIVDMPGYGYAKINKNEIENLSNLIIQYFITRKNLRRVFLLIDSRFLIKDIDLDMMNIFDKHGISYQIILTKIDEIKKDEINSKVKYISEVYFPKHTALFNEVLFCSSKLNINIDKIRNAIYNLTKY